MMEIEFEAFPKIARLSRPIIVTEKIDGTNAQIHIEQDGTFLVGSRKQWLTKEKDNFGFHRWAHENKDELLEKKFKEAFEKADKTDTRPPHPFDYD